MKEGYFRCILRHRMYGRGQLFTPRFCALQTHFVVEFFYVSRCFALLIIALPSFRIGSAWPSWGFQCIFIFAFIFTSVIWKIGWWFSTSALARIMERNTWYKSSRVTWSDSNFCICAQEGCQFRILDHLAELLACLCLCAYGLVTKTPWWDVWSSRRITKHLNQ